MPLVRPLTRDEIARCRAYLDHEARRRSRRGVALRPCQAAVLTLAAEGLTPAEIAAARRISVTTVKLTLREARVRLGSPDLETAIDTATRHGLITRRGAAHLLRT